MDEDENDAEGPGDVPVSTTTLQFKPGKEYRCPERSYVADGVSIPSSFADCKCEYGFMKMSISCEKKMPIQVYLCPPRSYIAEGVGIPMSFEDCVCEFGFVKTLEGTCVPKTA